MNNNPSFEPGDAKYIACRFYGSALGCRFGDVCHYSHESPNSVPMCKNFVSGCYHGDKCHYRHKDFINLDEFNHKDKKSSTIASPSTSTATSTATSMVNICRFYNTSNGCMRGVTCNYKHIKQNENDNNNNNNNKLYEKKHPSCTVIGTDVRQKAKIINKSHINPKHILLVFGFIKNLGNIPARVIDIVLFYFAKPIFINVKYMNVIQSILYCPINDDFSSMTERIKNKLVINQNRPILIKYSAYDSKRINKENWHNFYFNVYKQHQVFNISIEMCWTGVCERYSDEKGFGFITCEDGSDAIFVHHSEIFARGFRTLQTGESVEFEIIVQDDGRRKAINVTGPNGAYVQGQTGGTT